MAGEQFSIDPSDPTSQMEEGSSVQASISLCDGVSIGYGEDEWISDSPANTLKVVGNTTGLSANIADRLYLGYASG